MKNCFFLLLFIMLSVNSKAQFLPEKLGASVNSDYDEINPVISPGGDTLYFTRVGHPENNFGAGDSQDIWYTVRSDKESWSEAKRLPNSINIGRYNALFSLSPDGSKALINGVYNRNGNLWKKRGLSIIERSGQSWGKPQMLKVVELQKMMDGHHFSADMNWDEEIIIMSFNGSFNSKKSNLFVTSRKGEKYRKPSRIKHLNVSGNEFSPFLSSDGTTVYYSSNMVTDGYDVFKAVRKNSEWKEWSAPQPLSDTINTMANESYFRMVSDGSAAYYSSDRTLAGNKDIYYIKLFEANPFIIVSGKVKYKDSNIPVVGRKIDIRVNGEQPDSLDVDQETGSYRLTLPLGEDYELKALVPDADFEPVVVAASGLKEMTEMEIDLNVLPWNYAKVRGKLMDKSTGSVLPSAIQPTIMINGKVSEQLVFEEGTRNFEATFPLGSSFRMKALADGYVSHETILDLTEVKEYVELEENIYLEKVKEATVSGKIVNQKTLESLKPGLKVTILINNEPGVAVIDSTLQQYKLRLPLGSVYTLEAKADNFYPESEVIDLSREVSNVKIYRDLYLNPLEVGEVVKLNNITFEPARAILKSSSYPELQKVVKLLQENSKIKIQLAGHTDSDGSNLTNQKLSNLRAKAVKEYLIAQGIDPARLTHHGYGETSPIADNSTAAGKQLNRRVEFMILENH